MKRAFFEASITAFAGAFCFLAGAFAWFYGVPDLAAFLIIGGGGAAVWAVWTMED